jgi:tetratricopeptide (TPR) repeat protein
MVPKKQRKDDTVMNTGILRSIALGWVVAHVMIALPAIGQVQSNQIDEVPSAGWLSTVDEGEAGISEAESFFRQGVDFYRNDRFREALTQFNRALALEPEHEQAKSFQEMAASKLRLAEAGVEELDVPRFQAFDPESIAAGETPPQTAEEMRRDQVRELMINAGRYMEHQRFDVAVELYQRVIQLDPRNEAARDGLHKATLGATERDMLRSQQQVDEDRVMIRRYIEESKTLPEGADATGIKPYRFSIPDVEEVYEPPVEVTRIERTLESVVNLEFEDIHIRDIIEFIGDTYDINIVIDNRAVRPEPEPLPEP